MTFEQMRNEGKEPQPANGVICKNCGCGNLERYGGGALVTGTVRRYRRCRNCGAQFETRQPPERILREVEPRDEPTVLKVRTA
jgi:hypothetical protein